MCVGAAMKGCLVCRYGLFNVHMLMVLRSLSQSVSFIGTNPSHRNPL